jgi:threonine/homoserine/homoserine lactone efflux protein
MIDILMKSIIIGYSGALMPGTLLTYTVDKSYKKGLKAGFFIPLGHVVLELLVIVLLLIGFGKYLEINLVRIIIGFAGGILLSYMGINMIYLDAKNKLVIDEQCNTAKKDKSSNKYMFFSGIVLSATNPYFTIWWTAIGLGLILSAYSSYGIVGVIVFFIGHAFCDISWYLLVSFLIHRSKSFINIKVYRIISAVLGALIIFFGITFIKKSIELINI